jgi:hypothetical protein
MSWMEIFSDLKGWQVRRYAVAVLAGLFWLVLSGVPTGLISNPLYHRMTPVVWWDYPFWVAGAGLGGLLLATYVNPAPVRSGAEGGLLGGIFSVFAIGCPLCNKLVVLVLGASGALTYFAPIQPLLGLLSVGMLLYALYHRLKGERSCLVGRSEGAPRS